MADIIQIRRGTAPQWFSTNPILADGELGFETDSLKGKLGNGISAWNSLPYSWTGVVTDTVPIQINAAPSKATPIDADNVGITDSADSGALKRLSWENLKATIKTYLDGFYEPSISKGNLVQGTNVSLTGDLTNRLIGSGNVTINSTSVPTDIAATINAATTKTIPVDADQIGIVDSADLNSLKKLSWVNLKATLKTYLDTLYSTIVHTHSASDITSGTLPANIGGTGISLYTAGNYVNAATTTTLQERTPAQVLSDIGAAATSHNNAASTITAGTFATGNFIFPGNLEIQGQVNSPINAKGNSETAVTFNWSDGNIQTVTMTGNAVFTFSNPVSGASYQIIITQDGTGGRTITWPTIHWEGKTVPSLTGTLNSKDIVTLTYDGTNYNGVISKNFGTP